MTRNNEREQRVIRIMEQQRTRIGYVSQIAAALREAGAEGEQAIRVLSMAIERQTAIGQAADDYAKTSKIEQHLASRAYDGADDTDILAALAQLLHERTAVRIADAYATTHPPTTYAGTPERLILSAEEASEQAAARGIAYAADLED